MFTSEFSYCLPSELISQQPLERRDHSRLLALSRGDGVMEHRLFGELGDFLNEGDLLVFNDTRVLPARLYCKRLDTSGRIEVLLVQRLEPGIWKALGKPGRKLRPGCRLEVIDRVAESVELEVLKSEPDGVKVVRITGEERLSEVGVIPLPPYIHQPLDNPDRYQTVYARTLGSVAAPTAGLHFTPGLLKKLSKQGVRQIFCTLHIGMDTFRPVKSEDPSEHTMHSEYYSLGKEAVDELNSAWREDRRVIAVGTTVVRLLEHVALHAESMGVKELSPMSGWSDLFIRPGHNFRLVKGIVTNFHLPRSTLLMLVSAFAGWEKIFKAYEEAIRQKYRFYSFGDCMIIT